MRICKWRPKTMPKKRLVKQIWNYTAVILGTFLLSFGSVIFLTKCELVAGGVSGLSIILNHFIPGTYDYFVAGFTMLFWIIGLIFIGKDFAIKTLLSSILYIGFTFLLVRVDFFSQLGDTFAGLDKGDVPQVGNYILCAIFGGVFVGGGVALTFLGGGSTGGVDVIQFLMSKYFKIKESITSFIVDAIIILVGMIALQQWVPALCGVLSAFMTAGLIEVVYIRNQTSYQVDIISDKWEEISRYAQDTLDRGCTIIHAQGGYKGEERVILRVVFDKSQYDKIREYIAQVDPHAFVTFTQTNAVYGEGFRSNRRKPKINKK